MVRGVRKVHILMFMKHIIYVLFETAFRVTEILLLDMHVLYLFLCSAMLNKRKEDMAPKIRLVQLLAYYLVILFVFKLSLSLLFSFN